MAGNLVMGGGRVVDPSHPLVGPMGTRSSSHMVPRSGMNEQQRLQQTMFGMVPGSGPVNQKIGQNPQIYMDQQLPNVPGLTTINGVSTGIVAGEAARHHAMMATLAMQSKEEIATLKKQIVATGTVSKDLMVQFDGMLPVVSQLTSSAAQQSAMIVAELRAGSINIEQARARIIQLNLDIERMMAQAVQAQAGSLGRTINPTMIPTLNQPVVDPTGKSNMRELFKKGSTRNFINRVAGSLGVRTSGAGYNIETTKPRKLAMGEVGIQRYAAGYTSIAAAIKAAKMLRAFRTQSTKIGGVRIPSTRSPRAGAEDGAGISYGELYKRKSKVYDDPELQAYGISPTKKMPGQDDEYLVHGMVPGFIQRIKGLASKGSSGVANRSQYSDYNLQLSKTVAGKDSLQLLPTQFIKNRKGFNEGLRDGKAFPVDFRPVQGEDMVSLLLFLKSQGIPPVYAKRMADNAARVLNHKIANHKGPITESIFGKYLNNASVRAIQSGAKPQMVRKTNPLGSDAHSRNMGLFPIDLKENAAAGVPGFEDGITKLPGYGGGDSIPALLEPGESVVTKTATSGNEGTLALMNKGYPVDSILGFKKGVVGAFGSGFQNARNKPSGGGG
jgi:hypothetical protein